MSNLLSLDFFNTHPTAQQSYCMIQTVDKDGSCELGKQPLLCFALAFPLFSPITAQHLLQAVKSLPSDGGSGKGCELCVFGQGHGRLSYFSYWKKGYFACDEDSYLCFLEILYWRHIAAFLFSLSVISSVSMLIQYSLWCQIMYARC